jgi:hypothetical protein
MHNSVIRNVIKTHILDTFISNIFDKFRLSTSYINEYWVTIAMNKRGHSRTFYAAYVKIECNGYDLLLDLDKHAKVRVPKDHPYPDTDEINTYPVRLNIEDDFIDLLSICFDHYPL